MAHDLAPRDSVEVKGAQSSVNRMRYVFYGLQLAGLSGAVVILLTALIWRKAARRHASWLNFMLTWIISCTSYLFLIGESLGAKPNHTLCLLQAALIYSVPTLTAGATIALVIHVYITLRSLLTAITHRASWTAALVIGPYIPAWGMFLAFLKMGLDDPSRVQRPGDGTYCTINTKLPARVSAAMVATIMILCLSVEAIIFRNLRRAWAILKRDDDRSSVSMVIRVLAFTSVGMLSIILSLIFMVLPNTHDTAFNVVISLIPVSSVLIFGTQKDIFSAWLSVTRIRRQSHGADTWETFTPTSSSQIHPQVTEG
ncbi:hypothetical protein B0H11DRAFT_1249844 [Mycena galericulata]|nr:hypothetical protein B0H11DRAFT_1249844 [Mycena galericulata]